MRVLFFLHSLSIHTKLAIVIFGVIGFISFSSAIVAMDVSRNQTNQVMDELIQSNINTNEDFIAEALLANDAWALYKFLKALTGTSVVVEAGVIDKQEKIIAHTDTENYPIGEPYENTGCCEVIPFINNEVHLGTFVIKVEKQSIQDMIKKTFMTDFLFILAAAFFSFLIANYFINKLLSRFNIVLHNAQMISERKWDEVKEEVSQENDEITDMIKNSIAFMGDIKESIEAEEALKDFYHTILKSVDTLIIICDKTLTPIYQNDHALGCCVLKEEKTILREELITTLFTETKDEYSFPFSLPSSDKCCKDFVSTVLVNVRHVEAYVVVSVSDITRLKELEENQKVMHSLEMLGEISSQFAHEVKNLLQPLKLLMPKESSPDAEDMPIIHHTLERIRKQVSEFLQLGKPVNVGSELSTECVSLLQEIEKVLHSSLEEKSLHVKHQIEEDMRIELNQEALEIVLMNLLTNAIEASYENEAITISWESIAEDMTLLSVRNVGESIPDRIKERIFKPFFTTKKEGTGLGLFSVYKIIYTAKGRVEVESKNGLTTFKIYIPQRSVS